MITGRKTRTAARREAGYSLLFAIFLTASVLIFTAVAAPVLLTQGRREKEEELVWRGNQYARGVRLYYRKYGRFPQSLDDVVKPKNDIRFLRKEYKDPMNKEDGSWRLIYIAPNGQIIGSLKQRNAMQIPTQPGAPSATKGPGQPGTPAGNPPVDQDKDKDKDKDKGQPQQPAPTGPVIGGNIIGVGSKVNKPSLRVYEGGTTYREWEFIWDLTKEAAAVGQTGAPGNPQAPPTGAPPNPPPRPPRPMQ